MHNVVALALPEVVAFDLSIPAQVFGHTDERTRYAFTVCAPRRGPVPSTTGFTISAGVGLDALRRADTIVVPGYLPTDDPSPEICEALRQAHRRGTRIASVCVGAFAVAAAGLFDGRGATTHWQHSNELQARFPAVDVRPEVLYVDEGSVLSSAGIAAGIDLCLHLVRQDFGAVAAARVSRRMVAALHRSGGQAQFIERPLPATGPPMADTCAWAQARLEQPLTVAALADHAGYSARSFTRRFTDEVGISPLRWLTAQRVLEARRLLESTSLPVEEIAQRCGLGTAANLRVHFARETATTPTAYRSAYHGA